MPDQTPEPTTAVALTDAHQVRLWAAREAAGILRAQSLVSSGAVEPFDVLALAEWLATGNVPGLEVTEDEIQEETTMADEPRRDDTWDDPEPEHHLHLGALGPHYVTVSRKKYTQARERLAADTGAKVGNLSLDGTISNLLGTLGLSVYVQDGGQK